MERNVSVETERDIVTINIREGKQIRFMDISRESAKELFYQLSQIDFEEIENG